MSGGYAALLARRERLVARAATQRDDMAREVGALKEAADRGRAWLGGLKRNAPFLGIGLGVVLLALGRRRRSSTPTAPSPSLISRVFQGGLAIWRFTRWLR